MLGVGVSSTNKAFQLSKLFQFAKLANPSARHLLCTNAAQSDKETKNETTSDIPEAQQKLVNENNELKIKLKDVEDKYMRALAEAENVRTRLTKQAQDAKLFGVQKFCKDLLGVSDTLSIATKSVPAEQLENNSLLKSMFDGLKMTETELLKTFGKHGLVKIEPEEGTKFDPNFHEALFMVPLQPGKTGDTVAVVTKVGFALHKRTLRPAAVGVYNTS